MFVTPWMRMVNPWKHGRSMMFTMSTVPINDFPELGGNYHRDARVEHVPRADYEGCNFGLHTVEILSTEMDKMNVQEQFHMKMVHSDGPVGDEQNDSPTTAKQKRVADDLLTNVDNDFPLNQSEPSDCREAGIDPIGNVSTLDGQFTALTTTVATPATDQASLTTRVDTLEADTASLTTRVDTLEADATSLTTRVDTLEADTAALTTRVDTLEADTAALRADTIMDIERNIAGIKAIFMAERNRQLVHQILYAYQYHVSKKYVQHTGPSKHSKRTHASIAKEARKNATNALKFQTEVENEFAIVSSGKLNTTKAIHCCLAQLRNIGLGGPTHLMYDEDFKLVHPTADDMRKIIAELDRGDEETKDCARGALNVLLSLTPGNTEFLKIYNLPE